MKKALSVPLTFPTHTVASQQPEQLWSTSCPAQLTAHSHTETGTVEALAQERTHDANTYERTFIRID